MTHRQYEAWQEWLELEWNKPSRGDYYVMRVAAEIKGLFSKTSIDLESLRIEFKKPVDPKDLPPDDPNGPKRLRTKEDVAAAQEKVNKAMRLHQLGALK